MSATRVIIGDRFIAALQEAGILSEHTTSVVIRARVGDICTVEYEVLGDESLVAFADSLSGAVTEDHHEGIVR